VRKKQNQLAACVCDVNERRKRRDEDDCSTMFTVSFRNKKSIFIILLQTLFDNLFCVFSLVEKSEQQIVYNISLMLLVRANS
jgi:hypothetical protein